MAMAPSLRWLFVGRLIFRDYSVEYFPRAFAYITDVYGAGGGSARKKFWVPGAGVLAWEFVVGPAVGGLLGQYNLRGAVLGGGSVEPGKFFCYGLFCAAGNRCRKKKRAKSAWHIWRIRLGSLTLLRVAPRVGGNYRSWCFCTTWRIRRCRTCFVLYTEYRYGWNTRSVGILAGIGGEVCRGDCGRGGMVGPYVKKIRGAA